MAARANVYILPDAVDSFVNGYDQPIRVCYLGPDVQARGVGMDVSDVSVAFADSDGAAAMRNKIVAAVDAEATRLGYNVTRIIVFGAPDRAR